MILDVWDNRVIDIVNLGEEFHKESLYSKELGMTYSSLHAYNTLFGAIHDPNSAIMVDYTDNVLNGAAIVQKVREYHDEYMGYLSKFYVNPKSRQSRSGFRLFQDCVDWFDKNDCKISFCTATADVGRNDAFVRLAEKFGYVSDGTGILRRKRIIT